MFMKFLIFISILFSSNVFATELKLFCQYTGQHDGETFQFDLKGSTFRWTETLPSQNVVHTTEYKVIDSPYGDNRYSG